MPDDPRGDPRGLLDVCGLLRGEAAPPPTSNESALVLGLCSSAPAHRRLVRACFVAAFGQVPIAVNRHWAHHFGAEGLPEARVLAPLPAEIEGMCRPLDAALDRAMKRLASR